MAESSASSGSSNPTVEIAAASYELAKLTPVWPEQPQLAQSRRQEQSKRTWAGFLGATLRLRTEAGATTATYKIPLCVYSTQSARYPSSPHGQSARENCPSKLGLAWTGLQGRTFCPEGFIAMLIYGRAYTYTGSTVETTARAKRACDFTRSPCRAVTALHPGQVFRACDAGCTPTTDPVVHAGNIAACSWSSRAANPLVKVG